MVEARFELSGKDWLRWNEEDSKSAKRIKENNAGERNIMDAINPTILNTTIEAIPTLTEENLLSNNTILCAIILSKLLATTHNNIANIFLRHCGLQDFNTSNHARVYNQFTSISFDSNNIKNFITGVRSAIVKLEDVGIKMEEDILTYDLLKRLLFSLDNIKQAITHSKDF
ncbi:hypothetical protein VP01_4087g1 [Puccinia sorghi]|uniref:Uncharacterized protein n=1 Tax=Puccinia sorghi TaxID=27349 RepID=A0A0L6URG9_9BASI|nr:hypothetical protein VP01_4087g1 [Puccinia sorghi]